MGERVVVVGAGLAGLVAALRLQEAGAAVTLVHQGTGGLQLGQGTIDVLGYSPERVQRPLEGLDAWAQAQPAPTHPYAVLGASRVLAGITCAAALLGPELMAQPPATAEALVNVTVPTAVGALRPTALVPPSMAAGTLAPGDRVLVLGPRQLKDCYPDLVAANLARTAGVEARGVSVDLPARDGEVDSSALAYARALDHPAYRQRWARTIAEHAQDGETVLLPAMLGLTDHTVPTALAEEAGHRVCEVHLPPPGVPGMRLNARLLGLCKERRVRLVTGSPVIAGRATAAASGPPVVRSLTVRTAGHLREVTCDHVVYAPGGFESGALVLDSHNTVSEPALGLPLVGADAGIEALVHGDYWGGEQPLFRCGVAVDDQMRVLGPDGPAYANLHAAGGILAGAIRWQEKSGDGIAVASAVAAADAISEVTR